MDLRTLSGLDLNLLVLVQALLEERHVTRAAARTGTSQPAMSRALARARELFGDPLLVRAGGTYQLTPRAQALLPRLEEMLQSASELLRPAAFDPRSAKGAVRIATPDVVAFLLVPSLLRRFAERAPGLDLELVRWEPDWPGLVHRGEVDLAVGFPSGTEPDLHARPLFESDWAVVLRRGHPALRKRWTPELYASLDHVTVALAGRGALRVDDVLTRLGLTRHVALRVPYPLLTPFLVAETDLVLTIVRWLAVRLSKQAGLVVRRPPVPLPRVGVPLVWHDRVHYDPRQKWVRQQLVEAAEELDSRSLRW